MNDDPSQLIDAGLEKYKGNDIAGAVSDWLHAIEGNVLIVPRLLCLEEEALEDLAELFDEEEAWGYLNSSWRRVWRQEKDAWFALRILWYMWWIDHNEGEDNEDKDISTARSARFAALIENTLRGKSAGERAVYHALEITYAHASFLRELDIMLKISMNDFMNKISLESKTQLADCTVTAEEFITQFVQGKANRFECIKGLIRLKGIELKQQQLMNGIRRDLRIPK